MDNVLHETHVMLHVNIFDQTQPVLVRKELTVGRLLEETLQEFKQELDLNRKYVLSVQGKPVDNDLPVLELGLGENDALVLSYELAHVAEPIAKPIAVRSEEDLRQTMVGSLPIATTPPPSAKQTSAVKQPVLQEMETGYEFSLSQFPAVIGRPKPGDASMIAGVSIDLSQFKEALTVSRPHAQVTLENHFYLIEAIKPDRPIYVNNIEYATGDRKSVV